MTTLDAAIAHRSHQRTPLAVTAFIIPAVSVAGFVVISLALKFAAHLALSAFRLTEDAYGQCAEFIVTAALAMFAVRKVLDLTFAGYDGRVIFGCFAALSALVMAFALSSGVMRVDFLISLLQMSALCLFAHLQFWRGGRG
jgi:hypothetical protein